VLFSPSFIYSIRKSTSVTIAKKFNILSWSRRNLYPYIKVYVYSIPRSLPTLQTEKLFQKFIFLSISVCLLNCSFSVCTDIFSFFAFPTFPGIFLLLSTQSLYLPGSISLPHTTVPFAILFADLIASWSFLPVSTCGVEKRGGKVRKLLGNGREIGGPL